MSDTEKHMEKTDELILEDSKAAQHIAGKLNGNLKEIENIFGVTIHSRGGKLILTGNRDKVESAGRLLGEIYKLVLKGYNLDPGDLELASTVLEQDDMKLEDIFMDTVCVSVNKKLITPKSINQKLYIEAIRSNDIVFGIGPAGTGKTYLAMAMAVSAYMNKKVNRIILARPAVEAGEKLGFLPGDMQQKVDPYLRPLFDALYDMMGIEKAVRLIEKNIIEIVPLAYMRGRTLNDAFVILDEAQNATSVQMKMFLTRLGFSSRAVITGDKTQIDLATKDSSGLLEAERILKDIKGLRIVYFSNRDVVRHPLIKKIIDAYESI